MATISSAYVPPPVIRPSSGPITVAPVQPQQSVMTGGGSSMTSRFASMIPTGVAFSMSGSITKWFASLLGWNENGMLIRIFIVILFIIAMYWVLELVRKVTGSVDTTDAETPKIMMVQLPTREGFTHVKGPTKEVNHSEDEEGKEGESSKEKATPIAKIKPSRESANLNVEKGLPRSASPKRRMNAPEMRSPETFSVRGTTVNPEIVSEYEDCLKMNPDREEVCDFWKEIKPVSQNDAIAMDPSLGAMATGQSGSRRTMTRSNGMIPDARATNIQDTRPWTSDLAGSNFSAHYAPF